MQMSLNIGTIDIQNQDVAKFVQNKSIDEIKKMFTIFLNTQAKSISNISTPKKGKWAKVADEMRGTMSEETVDYLKECTEEIRSSFELRNPR